MADITRNSIRNASLFASTSRVEAPFVRVTIGKYTFGVYDRKSKKINEHGYVSEIHEQFPNYVQSLNIVKTNGSVNQYKLTIKYPIAQGDDPNFFDKLLSTEGKQRNIIFSYGDASLPIFINNGKEDSYIYKNEEAIITKVTNTFDIKSSVITYNIEAVSKSLLSLGGSITRPSVNRKPSDVIIDVLYNSDYKLTDVYTGMKDRSEVEMNGWIAGDDQEVVIPTCTGVSPLEYINTCVSYMRPRGTSDSDRMTANTYALTVYDSDKGPYFKIQKVQKASSVLSQLCTYNIDIGYQSGDIITDFQIQNQENWSIYYDYNKDISNTDYVKKIDNKGNIEEVYSPQLKGVSWGAKDSDINWWSKVTQYPITVTLTMKGLLRPAVLMQYVKLNVWFWGHKHISSGYYIITSQTDDISGNGYKTTLKLVRIGEDEEMI